MEYRGGPLGYVQEDQAGTQGFWLAVSWDAPVIVNLDLKNIPARQKTWSLDESLLYDQGIVEELERDMNLFF